MNTIRKTHPAWTVAGAAIVGILFLAVLVGFSGPCQAGQEKSRVLARWGKYVITQADLDSSIESLPADAQMQLASPQAKREFLENLVQLRIVGAEARAQKIDKEKKMTAAVRDLVDSRLAQEYITRKLAALKQPGEKEIEAFYKANQEKFQVPAMVKAQHILIKAGPDAKPEQVAAAQAKAESVLKEAQAGGDFAKLAEKYSEDEMSKSRGGDLGSFSKDQMIPEFSEAAFNLKKGEVSKVVKTGYGFHIIRVNEIQPARVMELKEASGPIAANLYKQEQEKLVMGELDRLKKKYKVKITMPAPAEEKAPVQDKKE